MVRDILDEDEDDIVRMGLQNNLLEILLFFEINAFFVTKQVINDDHSTNWGKTKEFALQEDFDLVMDDNNNKK
jgi:hypothetical protein